MSQRFPEPTPDDAARRCVNLEPLRETAPKPPGADPDLAARAAAFDTIRAYMRIWQEIVASGDFDAGMQRMLAGYQAYATAWRALGLGDPDTVGTPPFF
jgi:hypothetical protein